MGPAQSISGQVWWSIYLKRITRGQGQQRYCADADWDVLDRMYNWRQLANTTELSVCDGDVALCHV